MSRQSHPIELVARAHLLRKRGFSYAEIADEIEIEFGVRVGDSTVRDWVTYFSRTA